MCWAMLNSCFAGINDHGPLVTISDFGNNNGLVLGQEIQGWRDASPANWKMRTLIDGTLAGKADATSIPGGPLESFRQLLEICAARGLPLRKGEGYAERMAGLAANLAAHRCAPWEFVCVRR